MHKTVKIEDAVGLVLAHDITEIRKGEFKGTAFKKGHRIQAADVCHLQRLGKRNIYVLDKKEGYLHENDAAIAMADAFCGSGMTWHGVPKEGKLKLRAAQDGLFKADVEALTRVNMLGDVMCASMHTNTVVNKGAVVAATRAIPLMVETAVVHNAVGVSNAVGGLFKVKHLRKANAGLIITGNEVFTRLIEDQFEPILRKKVTELGSSVADVVFAPDDPVTIQEGIVRFLSSGVDLILTTGGMSVDPDDVTRHGIQQAGGEILFYGAPVLPGAMFMVAHIKEVPVLGIPACGLYHEATILDLILPRILAGERIGRVEIARMGHGGLCLNCEQCRYPVCPFGK